MDENGYGQDGIEIYYHFRVLTLNWYFKKQVFMFNHKVLTS